MPKVSPIYTNFNSGEVGDLLKGRSDLDQYNKSGEDYQNTIVTQYGPFMNHVGSYYSQDLKDMTKVGRLLSFNPNDADAQIIEMGDLYFRFYNSSGIIGAPLVVASTYTEAEIPDVQYTQSNDVVTLTHESHKPAKLTRTSATTWTLADYTFVGNPYLPDNTTSTTLNPSATTGAITVFASANVFEAGHVGTFWKFGEPTGTPEKQGFFEITGFTDAQNVNATVINTLSTGAASTDWAEAAWSSVRGWPSRCWYVGSRLYFARTTTEPNAFWGSKPFIFDDFDSGTGLDDDAISEKITAASDIRFLTGMRTLLIGTNAGDFVVKSTDGGAITPENIKYDQETGWGAEAIQPQLVGSYAYAVQTKGRNLRELAFSFQEDSYRSLDVTVLAEHITESGIKEMAYARNPFSIVYCVRNDGTMALMTREVDQEVLGWTPRTTDGTYESVAVIPHPTEDHDMVWTIVKRTIDGSTERHVEYFPTPRIPARQELSYYVDDGLTYNAYDANTGDTLTLSAKTGTGITVTAGSSIFTAASEDQRIRAIDVDDGTVLGELTITQYNSGTEVLGDVDYDFDATSYAANAWGISVNTVSGLDHLEAKTVKLLVDGGTNEDLTVTSGAVTLADEDDGFIINVGLGIISRWKNLPIEAGSATGTAQGKKKRIYQCGFKVYRSLGMQVGGDVNNLKDLVLRDPDTLFGNVEAFITGLIPPQAFDGTNEYEGHIVIEQSTPLPMCILAVMPLLETYDK